jgi:hypothetical protein
MRLSMSAEVNFFRHDLLKKATGIMPNAHATTGRGDRGSWCDLRRAKGAVPPSPLVVILKVSVSGEPTPSGTQSELGRVGSLWHVVEAATEPLVEGPLLVSKEQVMFRVCSGTTAPSAPTALLAQLTVIRIDVAGIVGELGTAPDAVAAIAAMTVVVVPEKTPVGTAELGNERYCCAAPEPTFTEMYQGPELT